MIPSPTQDKHLLSEHQFYAKSTTQPPKHKCEMFFDFSSFELSDIFKIENILRLLSLVVISLMLYKVVRAHFRRRAIAKERLKPIASV